MGERPSIYQEITSTLCDALTYGPHSDYPERFEAFADRLKAQRCEGANEARRCAVLIRDALAEIEGRFSVNTAHPAMGTLSEHWMLFLRLRDGRR
jgi:hypothetical protein